MSALAVLAACVALGGPPLPPGDAAAGPHADSQGTFMGRAALPETDVGLGLVPDPALGLVQFFQDQIGDPGLELQLQAQNEGPGEERYAFVQSARGVPILGTFALAQLQDGLLHYAKHFLIHTPAIDTTPDVPGVAAQQQAIRLAREQSAEVSAGQGAPALAIYFPDSEPVLVWVVQVRTMQPFDSEEIYIDAKNCVVRGRRKTSLDQVAGLVTAMVEPCCQGDAPVRVALAHVEWARGLSTDLAGALTSTTVVGEAVVRLSGPYFRVEDYGRPIYQFMTVMQPFPAFNEVHLDNAPLSQVDPFYYATQARAWFRERLEASSNLATSRAMRWTNSQFPIRVNLPVGHLRTRCNAFYDGIALNFYVEDPEKGCNNSGQAAKIVFHEYGHGAHDHLTWSRATFDPQVSEGVADYFAASITGDPNITGLLGCDAVLPGRSTMRTCVNQYTYCHGRKCNSFPHDEPHNAAPVLCAALWDLRQSLGAPWADQFFLRFMTLASDMNSAYEAAIAADEDEDGDPGNGTDHSCAINRAFLGIGTRFAHFPDARSRAVPCNAP